MGKEQKWGIDYRSMQARAFFPYITFTLQSTIIRCLNVFDNLKKNLKWNTNINILKNTFVFVEFKLMKL